LTLKARKIRKSYARQVRMKHVSSMGHASIFLANLFYFIISFLNFEFQISLPKTGINFQSLDRHYKKSCKLRQFLFGDCLKQSLFTT